MMIKIIERIIANVLDAIYHSFGFALILAVLFMFLYMFAKDNGWKNSFKHWVENFKSDSAFRRVFFWVIYTAMLLFQTLLNRNMWMNPLSNVAGVWGLYNANGDLTTEAIENLVLFIPFSVLLFWAFREKIAGSPTKFYKILWKSVIITFSFSLTIELLQLFFRIGTFQLSDLFYNTLGGLIGGVIYGIGHKLALRIKRKEKVI